MLHLFLVETNRDCKSDEKYISDFIKYFYDVRGDKIEFIYLNGKGNYDKKEREINEKIAKYIRINKKDLNSSVRKYLCIDLDNEYRNMQDININEKIMRYAREKGYFFIWFYENIERVFLKKNVDDSQKKRESDIFILKNKIRNVNVRDFCCSKDELRSGSSNLKTILDTTMLK